MALLGETRSLPGEHPYAPKMTNRCAFGVVLAAALSTAAATIRYQINGGAEQVESDVALPWEMQYLVYDEIESSVTAAYYD
jgi:hypothetical protein